MSAGSMELRDFAASILVNAVQMLRWCGFQGTDDLHNIHQAHSFTLCAAAAFPQPLSVHPQEASLRKSALQCFRLIMTSVAIRSLSPAATHTTALVKARCVRYL